MNNFKDAIHERCSMSIKQTVLDLLNDLITQVETLEEAEHKKEIEFLGGSISAIAKLCFPKNED